MMNRATDIGPRPLYLQVRERLLRRLIEGDWQGGDLIPSEMQLAAEYQVSQGTVRKAIDTMVRENLLRRRQGRGTFVATSDDALFVFQFFRMQPDDGERVLPASQMLSVRRETPPAAPALALSLTGRTKAIHLNRVRLLSDVPVLVEHIYLDAARFDGFPSAVDSPNNLYDLYSRRWGITIGRTDERLKAVAADEVEADYLGCAPGTPLLQIERIARDLEDSPTEYRLSRCLTESFHYFSQLS